MNLFTSQFQQSRILAKKAHALIPGGSHTYAKGDDQYPVLAPGFIQRGEGCHVFDADGNEYIEYGMGNRAVGLGHAYPPVVRAAQQALLNGTNFTRPATLEVECAERFLRLIDSAEMVKFCKDGSDATSGAVRLARAYTGRDMVAICGDHPFFSVDDWFIGTTPMNAGIPDSVTSLTATFRYNDIESVRAVFANNKGRVAAIILEPMRTDAPKDNFLHEAMDICHENGALFILDEMITGFRYHKQGAQKLFNIQPDLSCFGKALGNGFSVSALAGKREYMRLGGIAHTDKPRVFLLSTTHGGETHALAAAIATMDVYDNEPVIEHMNNQGTRLAEGVNHIIAEHGLQSHVKLVGPPCNMAYATLDDSGNGSQALRSLFLQETIRRGVIMPSLVVSYSHSNDDIDKTIEAIDGALEIYAHALHDGVEKYLTGRPSQMVYRHYNDGAFANG